MTINIKILKLFVSIFCEFSCDFGAQKLENLRENIKLLTVPKSPGTESDQKWSSTPGRAILVPSRHEQFLSRSFRLIPGRPGRIEIPSRPGTVSIVPSFRSRPRRGTSRPFVMLLSQDQALKGPSRAYFQVPFHPVTKTSLYFTSLRHP